MVREEEIKYNLLRSGIVYGRLFPTDSPINLMMNRDGEIKVSMQGEFVDEAIDLRGKQIDVDWFADEIEPVLTVNGIDHSLGVFMPAKITRSRTGFVKTVNIQAFDRCWRLRDSKLESSMYFAAGLNYIDVIENLITSAGIANIIKVNSDAVLTEARQDWKAGDSYLSIINQLLSEINYKQLWFNYNGIAMLEPKLLPTAENIKHVFTDKEKNELNSKEVFAISITPTILRETDVYSTPNVFVCICSNADKSEAMIAIAENRNPQSPLSISRRGRKIVSVVNIPNIASQFALQTYANNLLSESMIGGEIITVETSLLSDFGVDEVVAITSDEISGICIEKSWNMELIPGGKMTHTLERVVLNLG